MEKAIDVCSTPPLTVLIRPADPSDLAVVYQFLCELEETNLDFTPFRAVFRHNLMNPMVHYLMAEHEGEVAGFVSCHVQYLLHHTGKVGEIQELYVRPEYRSQRVGRQLVSALHALAVEEDWVHLEVTTNRKRTDTVRFYERESFVRSHFKLVRPIQA